MALDPRTNVMAQAGVRAGDIDEGLRSYMLRVYNYMALGVAFTGVVSLAVASDVELMMTIATGNLFWVLFAVILGIGFMSPRLLLSGSVVLAQGTFWLYAALWGILIAPMFYFYTGESVARVFFITAASFAALSLFGYTTKRDLTAIGRFLCMATFGLLIAILANWFIFASTGFDFILSIAVVLVFAGLTAYDTQAIKNMYLEGDGSDVAHKKAIFGAFRLYGDFVVMFVWMLRLFGNRG